jgi:hypothetical protein
VVRGGRQRAGNERAGRDDCHDAGAHRDRALAPQSEFHDFSASGLGEPAAWILQVRTLSIAIA